MPKVYIVRKFVAIEGGARHYYEEEVFDKYQLALNFLNNISNEDDDFFLSEIVTCSINNEDIDKDKEVKLFDFRGNLLCSFPQSNNVSRATGLFELGDIVRVAPFPWNQYSPTYVGTIGVVTEIPILLAKQAAATNADPTCDNNYVVDYIRAGYLGHWHVDERAIQEYTKPLPDNLIFLKLLSEHYKGGKVISEKNLRDAYTGDLFVEKLDHFNFSPSEGKGE